MSGLRSATVSSFTGICAQIRAKISRLPTRQRQSLLTATLIFTFIIIGGSFAIRTGLKSYSSCHPSPDNLPDSEGFTDPFFSRPTAYKSSADLSRPPNECAEALDFPQIALLFLTTGDLYHEVLWREWFGSAAGRIPAGAAWQALCTSNPLELHNNTRNTRGIGTNTTSYRSLPAACSTRLRDGRKSTTGSISNDDVIGAQHLFDVWVHPALSSSSSVLSPKSLFNGYELPLPFRVKTVWGTHTLIDATRALLAAALTNPRAVKFVLISESDIPLYSPMMMYEQLVNEPLSRINACNTTKSWDTYEAHRLRDDMVSAGIPRPFWRKSYQWVALSRPHAQMVVTDEKLDAVFRATCRDKWDQKRCGYLVCYSDEHYIPTLLAMAGVETETDCGGWLTSADWSRYPSTVAHPYHYTPNDVTPRLIRKLRETRKEGCSHAAAAAAAAAAHFFKLEAPDGVLDEEEEKVKNICSSLLNTKDQKFVPLGPLCPLLARKFVQETVDAVLATMLPCSSKLGIVNLVENDCEGLEALRSDQILLELGIPPAVDQESSSWGWARWSVAILSGVGGSGGVVIMWHRRRQRRRFSPNKNSFYSIARA